MSAGRRSPLLEPFPPFEDAVLVSRRNRFVAEVRLADGREALAHVANTGRLPELMVPGRRVLLRPAADGSARRTPYSLALIESPPPRPRWLALETPLANRLFARLVDERLLAELSGESVVRAEVAHGRSRFDFLLADARGGQRLVEVKSANLFVDGEARFPDAPTERGRKHLDELSEHARAGHRAAVVFVLMGGRASRLRPNAATDPLFARALAGAAEAGVLLLAARLGFSRRGVVFEASVPVEPV